MSTSNVIFLIIVVVLAVVYILDRMSGHEILHAFLQWKPALAALTALAKAISNVLPSSDFALAVTVLEAASRATQQAEELYKLDKLPKEERNAFAQQMIATILIEADIEVTEEVQKIIDGCITIVCMLMPHNVKPVAQAEIVDGKLVDAPC